MGKYSKKTARAANGCGTLVKHGRYWQARWMVNGRVISKSLKTEDENEARIKLERLSVQRSGQDTRETLRKIESVLAATMTDVPERLRSIPIGVGELFELFADAPNRRPVGVRTLEVYRGQYSVFASWMGSNHPELTNVRDVSQTIADQYAKWRAKTKSANTHNKDLNLLGQIWRTLGQRYALEYNPWTEDHIARLPLRPNRRRNLTHDECRSILQAATLEERAMIMIALGSGLRLGDVVRMQWSNIDLEHRWISKVNSKTGKLTEVPMVASVLSAVEAWRIASHRSSGPVFPDMLALLKPDGDTETISRRFIRLFNRVGITTSEPGSNGHAHPVATFHSLRHTFVTNLIEAGISPVLVKDAVGHSVMAMTENYTHVGEKPLREALERSVG